MPDARAVGLASSGKTIEIPGTNTTVRVDLPHVPGQQKHAHVCQKGCEEIVINADGTGSHKTDPSKIKNKKVLGYLAKKGFKVVLKCGAPVFFIYDWSTGGFGHAVDELTWPLRSMERLMAFKLYGYSRSDDDELLDLREVTICVTPKQARALSEFLALCAQEMEANPAWEHKHFSGGGTRDFVVFDSRKKRRQSSKS